MTDTVVLAVYCTAASRRVSVHVFFTTEKQESWEERRD